jgi:[ribosomal protein S5]-alanine N-acetyltransferase
MRTWIQPTASEWQSLLDGTTGIRGARIAQGALPPPFLMALALSEIARGSDMRWNASRLLCAHGVQIVASGGFKGDPIDGRVEIGYGTAESERGLGHASWMAQALCSEARAQPGVREVLAESAIDNLASEAVLRRTGFEVIFQRADLEDGVLNVWRFR